MTTPSELVNINIHSGKKIFNIGNPQKKSTLDRYVLFQGLFREQRLLGVFEKNTATAMFENSAKYHELQLKERIGTPTLPSNCLAHSPRRQSFWDKIFFRFISISLASKLIISGRIRFSSAHVVRTVGHIKVFIIFLVFTFAAFSVKFLQLFRFAIWRYFSHCFKLESESFRLM